MKRNVFFILAVVSLLASSCGNKKTKETQLTQPGNDSLVLAPEKPGESEKEETGGQVVLNNGEKWAANAETTEGIRKMEGLVQDFMNKGKTDFARLSETLENEFTTILKKCTMTGEAHTQLHNYLAPLEERIKKLKESTGGDVVKEIQAYLSNFNNYFH